jgi:hypothetical protein
VFCSGNWHPAVPRRSVRRVAAGAAALLAGAALVGEARAADGTSTTSGLGIKLPAVEVDLPPVQIKVPSVEVNLTPVEVKVPSVEVQLPPVEVKLPPVEATVPLDVKVPQVQAPSQNQDAPASAPRAPSGGGSAPTSTSRGEGAPTRETAQAGASGPAASDNTTTYGGATRGGSTTRRDATSAPRRAGADPGGDRSAPRATRRRDRRLRRVVQRLSGCLGALPSIETRVLTLRAGGQARPSLSRRQVARRLDVGVHRVAAVERRGLDRLRDQARRGGCGEEPAAAAVPVFPTATDEAAAPPAEPAASPPLSGEVRGGTGVVETVKHWLGGEAAPELTPRLLLIRATSPPVLLLLIAAFLVGFGINWVADWRAVARRPASS